MLKVFAVVTAVVLIIGVFAMSNLSQSVMARNNDKCLTVQTKDKLQTIGICITGNHDEEELTKDVKKQCKDELDNKEFKCTSSQTGNGASPNGNFVKNKD